MTTIQDTLPTIAERRRALEASKRSKAKRKTALLSVRAMWTAKLDRERREIPDRVAVVREAKIAVSRRFGRTWLTDAELDAVLPMEGRR